MLAFSNSRKSWAILWWKGDSSKYAKEFLSTARYGLVDETGTEDIRISESQTLTIVAQDEKKPLLYHGALQSHDCHLKTICAFYWHRHRMSREAVWIAKYYYREAVLVFWPYGFVPRCFIVDWKTGTSRSSHCTHLQFLSPKKSLSPDALMYFPCSLLLLVTQEIRS